MPSKRPATHQRTNLPRQGGVNPMPQVSLDIARDAINMVFWQGLISDTAHTQVMGTLNHGYRQLGNGSTVQRHGTVIPLEQRQAS